MRWVSGVLVFSALSLFCTNVFGKERCRSIDLRNETTAPMRSQYIFDPDTGEYRDTQLCHAFTAANLLGQRAGEAISPEALAVFEWGLGEYAYPYSESVVDWYRDLTGFVKSDIEAALKVGYISQLSLDRWANFYDPDESILSVDATTSSSSHSTQALMNIAYEKNYSFRSLKRLLKKLGKKKLKLNGWEISDFKSYSRYPSVAERNRKILIERLDTVLEQNRFVAFDSGGHYTTIVGRTEDCKYLIQDSIPKAAWIKLSQKKNSSSWFEDYPNSIFISEHLQVWGPEDVLNNLEGISYFSRTTE